VAPAEAQGDLFPSYYKENADYLGVSLYKLYKAINEVVSYLSLEVQEWLYSFSTNDTIYVI